MKLHINLAFMALLQGFLANAMEPPRNLQHIRNEIKPWQKPKNAELTIDEKILYLFLQHSSMQTNTKFFSYSAWKDNNGNIPKISALYGQYEGTKKIFLENLTRLFGVQTLNLDPFSFFENQNNATAALQKLVRSHGKTVIIFDRLDEFLQAKEINGQATQSLIKNFWQEIANDKNIAVLAPLRNVQNLSKELAYRINDVITTSSFSPELRRKIIQLYVLHFKLLKYFSKEFISLLATNSYIISDDSLQESVQEIAEILKIPDIQQRHNAWIRYVHKKHIESVQRQYPGNSAMIALVKFCYWFVNNKSFLKTIKSIIFMAASIFLYKRAISMNEGTAKAYLEMVQKFHITVMLTNIYKQLYHLSKEPLGQ